jgi:uncharacterized Zn finger protein
MKKKEKIDYNKEYFNNDNLFSTKYDSLFRDVIKKRGISYYANHAVTNFCQIKNKISAVVKGTIDYHVSVEYLKKEKIKVKCECPYHKDTDQYCKHVYALILTLKMLYEKEKMLNLYKINYQKIIDIEEEINTLVTNNKKYLGDEKYSDSLKLQDKYDENLEIMQERFDYNDDISLINSVHSSYFYLNRIIDEYNEIVDWINLNKQRLEEDNKSHITTYSFTIDNSAIFDAVDNALANVDISILKKARQDNIKNGKSTEIIDKAIRQRQRRDAQNKKSRKSYKKASFFGLLSRLFFESCSSSSKARSNTDYLMPWEQKLVDKGEYEPYQFEEEELEEDDYYEDE